MQGCEIDQFEDRCSAKDALAASERRVEWNARGNELNGVRSGTPPINHASLRAITCGKKAKKCIARRTQIDRSKFFTHRNALAGPPTARAEATTERLAITTERENEIAFQRARRIAITPRTMQLAPLRGGFQAHAVERIGAGDDIAPLLKCDLPAAFAPVRFPLTCPHAISLCN